ncbi:MAG: S-layer protein, partial [Planctomycetaceae bacterium]
PSMVQVLHLSNGDTINDKLEQTGSRVDALLKLRQAGMSDATLLDEVYLRCLARYPTESEREELLDMLPPTGAADEREIIEDIHWAILSSREFLFNH